MKARPFSRPRTTTRMSSLIPAPARCFGPSARPSTVSTPTARRENVEAARDLMERHPEVGAIVLECTNMPPYAAAIRDATRLPVFDITTLVRMVYAALVPPVY